MAATNVQFGLAESQKHQEILRCQQCLVSYTFTQNRFMKHFAEKVNCRESKLKSIHLSTHPSIQPYLYTAYSYLDPWGSAGAYTSALVGNTG